MKLRKICKEELEKEEQKINVHNGFSISFRDIKSLKSIDVDFIKKQTLNKLEEDIQEIEKKDQQKIQETSETQTQMPSQ